MIRRALLAVPFATVVIVACSGTGGFKSQTEAYINDSRSVVALAGADVSNADCDEPDSAAVGTRYRCTADVDGVGPGVFDVRIQAEGSFLVLGFVPN